MIDLDALVDRYIETLPPLTWIEVDRLIKHPNGPRWVMYSARRRQRFKQRQQHNPRYQNVETEEGWDYLLGSYHEQHSAYERDYIPQ